MKCIENAYKHNCMLLLENLAHMNENVCIQQDESGSFAWLCELKWQSNEIESYLCKWSANKNCHRQDLLLEA